MTDDDLLSVLDEAATSIQAVLGELHDWGLAGTRAGQYRSDLAADEVAVSILEGAGLGVLSEETGRHHPDRPVTVVVDPVDGSTNASRGIPWYATSLCAVDADGPRVALVINLPTGTRFSAVRGGGATCDGRPIRPSSCESLKSAMVAISGYPGRYLGWNQFRALGASALDICAVAAGTVDAFMDCSWGAHGPWDYLGALLVCREAGAAVVDAEGRDLVMLDHTVRRTPVAAATEALLGELLAARSSAS